MFLFPFLTRYVIKSYSFYKVEDDQEEKTLCVEKNHLVLQYSFKKTKKITKVKRETKFIEPILNFK